MHPEVRQEGPGKCPKCRMALVPEEEAKRGHNEHSAQDQGLGPTTWRNYVPLIAIFALLFAATAVVAWKDYAAGDFSIRTTISNFMAGFFLVFAGFKLMDLQGFAHGYASYDLLAQRAPAYGYLYPFIELSFGLLMLADIEPAALLWTEFGVMAFSGLGVVIKLAKRERFQCACLGTFLKLPLTNITLVEDFGMAALALVLLFI